MFFGIHGYWQFPKGCLPILCPFPRCPPFQHTHTHTVFRIFSYFILYHEGKILKIELHVFLTARYNLKQVSPPVMFISCFTNGICDPKEAKTNNLCCQVLMLANLLLHSTLHELRQLIVMKELKTTLDMFSWHVF